ncbi:hypothetical protein [Flavobacterium rhizosphaerae]|uniref:Uncharacterized protein n=1 Tax=Flavobacterium rhizosphaerae TaxID=3163298 RepID=A0ABW8YYC3_9FLAO
MTANPFVSTLLHRTVTVAHFVNFFSVAATLIAYAIAQLSGIGIIIQFFLGCYQLVVAVLASFAYWKWKTPTVCKLLKIYWLLILAWLTCAGIYWIVNEFKDVEFDWIIIRVAIIVELIVLPMLIAIYFVYVTHRMYSDFKQ